MKTSQPVLVLDMTTLRFHASRGRGPVRLTTQDGQVLAVVYPRQGEGEADVAFRAMDAALATGTVLDIDPSDRRKRVVRRVALLNPFTGDVALEATPRTVTFADGATVAVDVAGCPGEVTDGTDGPELRVDGVTLHATVRGQAQLLSALEMHAA